MRGAESEAKNPGEEAPLQTSADHPILLLVGTRPEAIKLAPVVRACENRRIPYRLVSTGQHKEMLQQTLDDLNLVPDSDLAAMQPDQSLASLSAAVLSRCHHLMGSMAPSWVVVQGDTTTVAMAALAAFYRQIPVAHVEAGLRTGKRYDPFPEEMNRSLVGRLANLHLAPTAEAAQNLRSEGIAEPQIEITGNTVIDSLYAMRERVDSLDYSSLGLPARLNERPFVLITAHRRENQGAPMREVFSGLERLADRYREQIDLVYPVHLNPRVNEPAHEALGGRDNIHLMQPVGYRAFVKLMSGARLIVTDSGGVQEEATALGIPTLVTRGSSERPEAIASGVARLVGTDAETLLSGATEVLENRVPRAPASSAFGDGRAGERVLSALLAASAGNGP